MTDHVPDVDDTGAEPVATGERPEPEQPSAGRGDGSPPATAARSGRPRWSSITGVAVILLIGATLRLIPLTSSLPYLGYIDEGHTIIHGSTMVAEKTVDPKWYDYPTLPLAVSGIVSELSLVGYPSDQRSAYVSTNANPPYYDSVAPGRVILANRLATFLFSMGAVALSMLLGWRLRGRAVGLVTGLLAATLPAMIVRGVYDLVDSMATFVVLLAVLCSSAIGRARHPQVWCAVAGAVCGLAATTKYPSAAVFAVPFTCILLAGTVPISRALARVAIAGAAMALTVLVTMPALVMSPGAVRASITRNYADYDTKAGASYFSGLFDWHEVGAVLVVLALVGVTILLRDRLTRAVTAGYCIYAILLTAVSLRLSFQPFRNLLSLTPLLCLGAAVAVVALVRWAAERLPDDAQPWVTRVGVAALAVAISVVGVLGIRDFMAASTAPDSRQLATGWLADHLHPRDYIVVWDDLAIATSELKELRGEAAIKPATTLRDPAQLKRYRYIVTGVSRSTGPVYPASGLRMVAAFGTDPTGAHSLWRGQDERVVIFENVGASSSSN